MKKENEATIVNIPELFEMKLTQNDLINYVISKELDRIALLQEEERVKKKDLETQLEIVKKEMPNKIIEIGKSKLQKHVDLFPNSSFKTQSLDNDRDMSEMMLGGIFITPFGPMGMRGMRGDDWFDRSRRDNPNVIRSKNILIVNDKDTILASFRFDLSEEEVKALNDEVNVISNQIENVRKVLNNLDDQRSAVRNNSEKVRNRLIEQYLDSSEDGKKLLQNLQSIQLTNKQLELKK